MRSSSRPQWPLQFTVRSFAEISIVVYPADSLTKIAVAKVRAW
jgi:hypothetical protein